LKRVSSERFLPPERTEVPPVRKPITRALPDATFPVTFQTDGNTLEGSHRKNFVIDQMAFDSEYFERKVRNNPEYLDVIKSRHPDFESYSPEERDEAFPLLYNHPRFLAELAQDQNRMASVPSGPTATRTMTPGEQRFLTHAFRDLKAEFEANPFHIHGETAVVGNKKGEVTQHNYSPEAECSSFPMKENRYNLHTHPPFSEPFSSSASMMDHDMAAVIYRMYNHPPKDRQTAYVTNGKDVLHIQPDSMELVKLNPDPRLERELGEFPVAFTLPVPQPPPYPFSNHEAPVAFRPWNPES
jgi:hypothetical protein